ncbi:MAG: Lpg1974 family pore-forming outer membrane protein [Alphaproteobacteria bacterium]
MSVAAIPQSTQARNPFDPYAEPTGLWLEFEAAYQFLSGAKQPWAVRSEWSTATNLGFVESKSGNAGNFRVNAGYRFTGNWDIAAAYTGLRSKSKTGSISTPAGSVDFYNVIGPYRSYGYSATVEIKQRIDIADFEAGYNFKLGSRANLRAFAGVRFVNWRQDTNSQFFHNSDFTSPLGDDHAADHLEATYWGIGPRVGASGKIPIAQIGRGWLHVTGGIATAVLFGEARNQITTTAYGPTYRDEFSKTKAVFNLEAKLGLAYAFPIWNWVGTLSAGYRFDGWWGLVSTRGSSFDLSGSGGLPTDASGALGKHRGNLYGHGPFVSFRVAF